MYNNQLISVTGEGEVSFRTALSLFGRFPAVGYAVERRCHNIRLILFWHAAPDFPGYTQFLCPTDLEQTALLTYRWLDVQEYPPEPDHDGDNVKGWRIYNEDWTHVANRWEAFVAIEPLWMMAGK